MDDVLNVAGHRIGTMEVESSVGAGSVAERVIVLNAPKRIFSDTPRASNW